MKTGAIEFNLRELAGSFGDLGTLLPFTVGYITICGMDPSGVLITIGLANLTTGLIYRLPLPVEPMKVLGLMALAHAWSPERIYTSAAVMGVIWLLIGATGAISYLAGKIPNSVVRGIQISLGILLAVQGIEFAISSWLLGIISMGVILFFRMNRYAPASIILVVLGIGIMAFKGELAGIGGFSFALPAITHFDPREIWPVLRDGGFAQIPLTAANAVIATSVMISEYWPGRRVTERQLALNTGVGNLFCSFFGGMPLCHGAGGLAGQYYFGARTGGANLIEGAIEISLGLFLAGSIAALFSVFPMAIVGAMMIMVGMELMKFARKLEPESRAVLPAVTTVVFSVTVSMAIGFIAGLIVHYLVFERRKLRKQNDST